MKRPKLNPISMEGIFLRPGLVVTMSPGQWDQLLDDAYASGHTLLEVDDNEHPVRAYQKDAAR